MATQNRSFLVHSNDISGIPTSKYQIIKYIKYKLGIIIPSIESLGNGIIFAHLVYLYDNEFDIDRVYRVFNIIIDKSTENKKNLLLKKHLTNLNLKLNIQHLNLSILKIVQSHLIKLKIQLTFPIDKLSHCRLQDNLEVVQWIVKMLYLKDGDYNHWNNEQVSNSENTKKRVRKENYLLNKKNKAIGDQDNTHKKNDITTKKNCSGIQNIDEVTNILSIKKDNKINDQVIQEERKEPILHHSESKKRVSRNDSDRTTIDQKHLFFKELDTGDEIQTNPIITENNEMCTQINSLQANTEMKLKILSFITVLEAERDFYYEKLVKIEKIIKSKKKINCRKRIIEVLCEKRNKGSN